MTRAPALTALLLLATGCATVSTPDSRGARTTAPHAGATTAHPTPTPTAPTATAPTPDAPGLGGPSRLPMSTGIASWYGERHHGRRTANGETYDMHMLTAAHRTLPFGTVVEVTNLKTGATVEVRINDRGPHVGDRIIDLSLAAARRIGLVADGLGPVRLRVIGRADDNPGIAVPATPAATTTEPPAAQPVSTAPATPTPR